MLCCSNKQSRQVPEVFNNGPLLLMGLYLTHDLIKDVKFSSADCWPGRRGYFLAGFVVGLPFHLINFYSTIRGFHTTVSSPLRQPSRVKGGPHFLLPSQDARHRAGNLNLQGKRTAQTEIHTGVWILCLPLLSCEVGTVFSSVEWKISMHILLVYEAPWCLWCA